MYTTAHNESVPRRKKLIHLIYGKYRIVINNLLYTWTQSTGAELISATIKKCKLEEETISLHPMYTRYV